MTIEEAIKTIKESPLYNDTTWEFANKLHEAINVLETNDVLDKICAYIEQAKKEDFQRNRKTYDKCLQIIDKCRAESEE